MKLRARLASTAPLSGSLSRVEAEVVQVPLREAAARCDDPASVYAGDVEPLLREDAVGLTLGVLPAHNFTQARLAFRTNTRCASIARMALASIFERGSDPNRSRVHACVR